MTDYREVFDTAWRRNGSEKEAVDAVVAAVRKDEAKARTEARMRGYRRGRQVAARDVLTRSGLGQDDLYRVARIAEGTED